MKRFTLKKDLPWSRAGSVWRLHQKDKGQEYLSEVTELYKNVGKVPYVIGEIDSWFEELKETQPIPEEVYWYVNGVYGPKKRVWAATLDDKRLYEKGNFFRSHEEAGRAYELAMEAIAKFKNGLIA